MWTLAHFFLFLFYWQNTQLTGQQGIGSLTSSSTLLGWDISFDQQEQLICLDGSNRLFQFFKFAGFLLLPRLWCQLELIFCCASLVYFTGTRVAPCLHSFNTYCYLLKTKKKPSWHIREETSFECAYSWWYIGTIHLLEPMFLLIFPCTWTLGYSHTYGNIVSIYRAIWWNKFRKSDDKGCKSILISTVQEKPV